MTTFLPVWKEFNHATPEEQAKWNDFVMRVKSHEQGHVDLIDQNMKDLAKRIAGLSAMCCGPADPLGLFSSAEAALKKAVADVPQEAGKDLNKAHINHHKQAGDTIPCNN